MAPHKVAVLGNGPSYLRHRWGAQIDACDEIVRMNLYRLSPELTPLVGSRTTVWSMYHNPAGYALPREVWWIEFGGFDMASGRRYVERWCAGGGAGFVWLSDEVVQAGFDALGIAADQHWVLGQKGGLKPSSGIVSLQYAMQRWSQSTIYVAGLDGFVEGEQRYYWDSEPPAPRTVRVHAPDRQRAYIGSMIAAGRVKEFSDDEQS